ncbi:HIT domain-containing protein [Alteromonas sp. CI.11.F.A3]|uniref:HIT domain-containing protein n=1 Tax=Alteromonas sp. CI.11.F.A3 TaxID=3079555 RepID=UPI00294287C4|nr:HIT domain-containing protein [Alteromonas sp. CI.11.F.A3]WOI36181.1 HIT domain-containing protein [Alteromonas sp. CI.11.F.A3]
MFKLDTRLEADTIFIHDLPLCRVLLMNDSQFPWLILVPRVDGVTEIIELSDEQQQQFLKESAQVSRSLQTQFSPDKLNIAALGNVVSQLHIHHVARYKSDIAWPKPIWGAQAVVAYPDDKATELVDALKQALSK